MTTQTLSPSIDTYIGSDATSTNYGSATILRIGESNNTTATRRSLLKFAPTIVPNAVVTASTLSLYAITDYSSNARTLRIFRLKRDWVVNQATWNIYSTGNNWQTAGGFGANDCEQTDIGSINLSASEAVNAYKNISLNLAESQEILRGTWTNYGFLAKVDTEANDMYDYNSNDAANNKPVWTLTYTIYGLLRMQRIIGL